MGNELHVHSERRGGLAPGSGEQQFGPRHVASAVSRADSGQSGIALLKTWEPTRTALIGEMYFARGFAEVQLASDFCNGIPLSDGTELEIIYGDPVPVSSVFTTAIASFDAALAAATGTDAASVRIQRARARWKGPGADWPTTNSLRRQPRSVGPPAFRPISAIKRRRRSRRATMSSGLRGSAPSVTRWPIPSKETAVTCS